MPAGPGETLLTTLFADVHYHFAEPSPSKAQHHRFVRGSYVYIYHDAIQHQAKLEVANHAGTPEQDAFSGYLHSATLSYSYAQPTVCTMRIDAHVPDEKQWRLASYDEKNEQRFMYKLHSLDLYLWTEKDAAILLGHMKAVMPASRLDVSGAPSVAKSQTLAEHRDTMSPVVQQLERTAIGAQFPPRAESVASMNSLQGPVTPATSAGATTSPPVSPPQAPPMAYNPAAPPAPEPIMHREKTPPPPDGSNGTPMGGGRHDPSPQPQYANVPLGYHQNSNQPTPQQAYFGGAVQTPPQLQQPPVQRTYSGGVPPPPPGGPSSQPAQQQPYAQAFAPLPVNHHSQPTSPPPHQQNFHRQSTFGGPPGQTQFASYPTQQFANHPGSPSFGPYAAASPGIGGASGYMSMQPPTPSAPPAYAGHTPLQSPGLPPPPPQQPYQPAVGGYSNYNYTAAQQPNTQQLNQYGAYTGDIHSQVYRPTEAEQAHGHHPQPPKPPTVRQGSETKVRMEERVTNVEKKVGGFLKRLDKLI
ncbi:hypothetical protein BAUCODRAFT_35679 [Baudoinia panamericana UAMH 10762]|uniref:Uncharacterized protein n=1 Tax=Baudoinia panamericana (strain UAMH 10762) TaxID=717646 RepID=M2N5Z9_BAUPA|nr:uncharacterized protein BAUCODRAFT_35679 [Baudoinia panamericana UAMH 10762]EMC94459.1 hypothetical protein BAUCODRAFT_35679 [Baudoinia panamericana UAMH 10762]